MWTTASGTKKQSSNTYVEKISQMPENYHILEKIPLNPKEIPIEIDAKTDSANTTKATTTTVIIIDLETTGIEPTDKIIEIGMIKCKYNKTGTLSSIDDMLDMLQDPGMDIGKEVTELTGITNDMVKGKQIDWNKVQEMLQCNPTAVIAHNAKFDRPYFEKMCPNNLPWKCTVEDIPWRDIGHSTRSLGDLLMREGWFFDAHRAHNDCLATAWLLHIVPDSLRLLLEPTWKIMAWDSYNVKDILKKQGYRFDSDKKCWWVSTREKETAKSELEYLQSLYPDCGDATKQQVDSRTEYK